jgi:chromosome segregation ATPase
MPDPGTTALIITAAVSVLSSLVAGGAGVKWLLRNQSQKLTAAEVLVKRADAASRLAEASVSEIEHYRKSAERYMEQVNSLHADLLGAKEELAQLRLDLAATMRKLQMDEEQLVRARADLEATRDELAKVTANQVVSRRDLDRLGENLRKAEVRRAECEGHKASLQAELQVLRSRLAMFSEKVEEIEEVEELVESEIDASEGGE